MPSNARRPRVQVRRIVSPVAAVALAAMLLVAMATPTSAHEDPTTAQLAEQLDREVARLNAAVQSVLALSRAAERRADAKVAQSRRLAVAGMLLGLLGIVLAGIATASVRAARRAALAPPVQPAPLRAGPERTRQLGKLRA